MKAQPVCEIHGPKVYYRSPNQPSGQYRCMPCLNKKRGRQPSPWLTLTTIAWICPVHGQKRRSPSSGQYRCRLGRPFGHRGPPHEPVWTTRGNGWRVCKPCESFRVSQYAREHPEVHKRARAKRRGAKRGFWVTKRDRRRTLARQRGVCLYCQMRPATDWDHVIPVKRGGVHSIGNLVLACRPCNSSKGAKLPIEWYYERRYSPLGLTLRMQAPEHAEVA